MRPAELLARLTLPILRLYFRTLRASLHHGDGRSAEDHRFRREIYAISEGDLVAICSMFRRGAFHTLIAAGKDGDWATIVANGLGCQVVRGSARHDPLASAMSLVRALRASDAPAVLVVDGPLGPRGVAKDGVAAIARASGRPVIATWAVASSRIVLSRSWSRLAIPLPFTRVKVMLADPIAATSAASREELLNVTAQVTAYLTESALTPPSKRETAVAHG